MRVLSARVNARTWPKTPQRTLDVIEVAAGAMDEGITAVMDGGEVPADSLAGGDVDGAIRREWWCDDCLLEWWASLSCAKDRRREN